jgi:RNA ligase (TIGR02306 family)
MRKLATIETIKSVGPIEGADRIEAIGVRGWICVSGKGNFKVGDRCVYFEVDSALPLSMLQFAFLADHKKIMNGKEVHVLKTKRLRGVYSQGLCLPVKEFSEWQLETLPEGDDVSALLGIEKWEPPISASMGNLQPVGNFPTHLMPKTDAERCQNLSEDVWNQLKSFGEWTWTEKLDGTSMSVVRDSEGLRVCSRNLELKDADNIYWRMVRKYKLDEVLKDVGSFVQGEIVGPGVQGNPLGLKENKFFIFHWNPNDWAPYGSKEANALDFVPMIQHAVLPDTVAELITYADGIKSLISKDRLAEGVVLWNSDAGAANINALEGRGCFKSISNKYLSKQE